MKTLIGSLVVLPLLTAGVIVGASSAQAAAFISDPIVPGSVYSIGVGTGQGVKVNIIGGTAYFSFFSPIATNYIVAGGTTDTFDTAPHSFVGTQGKVKNNQIPAFNPPGTANSTPITAFMTMSPTTTFDLVTTYSPTFSTAGSGSRISTSVTFGLDGFFKEATTGKTYSGFGLVSATFVGKTAAQIIADAQSAQGISTSYSGTFTLFQSVPEPSNVAGLIVFAGASTLLLKRRQKSL